MTSCFGGPPEAGARLGPSSTGRDDIMISGNRGRCLGVICLRSAGASTARENFSELQQFSTGSPLRTNVAGSSIGGRENLENVIICHHCRVTHLPGRSCRWQRGLGAPAASRQNFLNLII